MKREDYEAPPCHCGMCQQAGVSERPLMRDPKSGKWRHGNEARKYWDAHDAFWARVKTISARKAMR